MLKLTVVVALLCATTFVAECTLEKPYISHQLTITMPKSTTVVMGDQMYTVSMTESNVHVNSSDPNHKPCDMAIDPSKNSIKDEMMVATTDNMMYVMGEHSVERIDNRAYTKYSLMMINPQDCTLKSADMSDVNVGMKPSLPRILINDMGVDVYFPSMRTCAPCQFSNDGTKMEMPAQITPPEARSDNRIFMFDVHKMGPNYLYAQNEEGRKATIKMLDGKTRSVTKEKKVDYQVDAMANTKAGTMGICSKEYDRRMADITAYKQINCERIDDKLDSSAKIEIPIGPHSRPISRVSYDIDDKSEKTYIGFAESKDLRVYVYDAAGKLLKAYDLGQIDERFEKYPRRRPGFYMPYTHWNVRGMIVRGEYCLVIEQVADKHEVDLHEVRCINM